MDNDESKVCPYCKGSRFLETGYVEKIYDGKRTLYPYTQPCYCERNKAINKQFGMLSGVPDAHPADIKKVRTDFAVKSLDKGYKGNMVIYGSDDTFRYLVKCFFCKNFTHKDYMILEGSGIVEVYHVPKKDNSWLTTAELNKYDLLAIMFTSAARYESMKACVLDVVKNRFRLNRPTWIYAYDEESLKSSVEYSDGLGPFLETYRKVRIPERYGFENFEPARSNATQIRKERDVQDTLGGSIS
jgi:hypothetical protein